MFGREGDIKIARDRLVHGDRRVLTLVGTGGVGKTTLAHEVARAGAQSFPDGVRVLDLTRLAQGDDVAGALVRALGVSDQGRDPRTLLEAILAPRTVLLVLDNCEHVVHGVAPLVDGLMDACPDLRILATSRTPLKIRGEAVLPVEPVAVPSPALLDPATLDELAAVPSVALFVERARAAAPGFRLTATNAPDVAGICRRLDGMPLALELAAALAPTLSAAEIAERLASREGLRLLEGGTGSTRHRTLEATLDWSHELLDPEAQALFRRLSVFVAGWTTGSAEAVGRLGDPGFAVVPHLATLVEHSLVRREEVAGRSRYRMLAPVAAYAAARLDASGERGTATLAHASQLLAITTSPLPFGQGTPDDVRLVEAELDDLRAALRAAEAAGASDLALALLSNLLGYWRIRGMLTEGLVEFDRILAQLPTAPSAVRASLLAAHADYLQVSGRLDLAVARALEAEEMAATLGDVIVRRTAIGLRGIALRERGDLDGARVAFAEAAALVAQAPADSAIGFLEAAIGSLELRGGDLDVAQQHLERAAAAFGRAPSWFLGRVCTDLGVVARRRGDRTAAREHFREALAWLHGYGAVVEAIRTTEEAAGLALDDQDSVRAATLLSAATALRDAAAMVPTPAQREAREVVLDQCRAALDARRFRTAWSRGMEMSLGDVVAYHATPSVDAARRRRGVRHGSTLTPREQDIAALVAQGLTNPQIATRLVLSPGTVRIHVERILGKLGLSGRVQIATWYLTEGNATDTTEPAVDAGA